jgi:hypothetical protein
MPEPAKHRITNADTGETIEVDMAWNDIRSIRDGWLVDTDFWMLADRYASLTPEQQIELTAYREALRNLPESTEDSSDCIFPDKPSWIV